MRVNVINDDYFLVSHIDGGGKPAFNLFSIDLEFPVNKELNIVHFNSFSETFDLVLCK